MRGKGSWCPDTGLLILRLGVGSIFLVHGVQKLMTVWSPDQPANWLMRFLSIAEPLGGLALILGVLTSWAGLGLALIMLGAIYMKATQWSVGFVGARGAGWEFDLALLAGALALFCLGGGKYGLESMKKRDGAQSDGMSQDAPQSGGGL